MSTVLIVTSDASTERLAENALGQAGYEVISAQGCDKAIRSLLTVNVDAVVLDSSIGNQEATEFCEWVSNTNDSYPLVLLAPTSARWLEDSLPLDRARDEVVTKPFDAREIRQAVERSLEAGGRAGSDTLMVGDAVLSKSSHELRGDGVSVQLTPTEFRLMSYLVQKRGTIVSSEELLEKVWEFYPGTGSSELVRSHVRNLRSKLRMTTSGAELVQTVPRRGYRLV